MLIMIILGSRLHSFQESLHAVLIILIKLSGRSGLSLLVGDWNFRPRPGRLNGRGCYWPAHVMIIPRYKQGSVNTNYGGYTSVRV